MNIVSIDFDIIMAPTIEFYNNMTSNPKLFEEPILKMSQADLVHYQRLSNWLFSQLDHLTKEDIIFIESHEQIVNYINEDHVFLVNIDHHHDLGYAPLDEIPEGMTERPLNCGNWGEYLITHEMIDKFVWVRNKNSQQPRFFDKCDADLDLQNYELNRLRADKIIICLSPEWVPPQYHPLYFLWLDLIGNYYNTHFDFKTRQVKE